MPDDPAKLKEDVLRLLAGVEPEAQKLEKLAQEIAQSARFARDCAKPLGDLVAHVPENQFTPEEWTRQADTWRAWHDTARHLHAAGTTVNSFGAQSYAATNTTASGVVPVFGGVPPMPPPSPAVEAAKTKLFQTLDRYPLAGRALASMHRLGLGSRGGDHRPPADLLTEARGALERPVVGDGGPISVLISLRECIGAVIAELVWRRPKQEPAKKWSEKIISVGRQCARPMLPPGHFDSLGFDADKLMDELSGAKQAGMDHDLLAERFKRGLLFLNALMDSIDESRLRPI